MKTIEQKAKAYDEALKWMRELYPGLHGATKEDAERYFSELRESEDEEIRRTLVEYFGPEAQLDFVRGVPIQKIRDWLEKQKESLHITESCKENADSFTDSSEDERIRKELVNFLQSPFIKENLTDEKVAPWLAYLEKQKGLDKMIVVSPEVWDNAISDAFENGKKRR